MKIFKRGIFYDLYFEPLEKSFKLFAKSNEKNGKINFWERIFSKNFIDSLLNHFGNVVSFDELIQTIKIIFNEETVEKHSYLEILSLEDINDMKNIKQENIKNNKNKQIYIVVNINDIQIPLPLNQEEYFKDNFSTCDEFNKENNKEKLNKINKSIIEIENENSRLRLENKRLREQVISLETSTSTFSALQEEIKKLQKRNLDLETRLQIKKRIKRRTSSRKPRNVFERLYSYSQSPRSRTYTSDSSATTGSTRSRQSRVTNQSSKTTRTLISRRSRPLKRSSRKRRTKSFIELNRERVRNLSAISRRKKLSESESSFKSTKKRNIKRLQRRLRSNLEEDLSPVRQRSVRSRRKGQIGSISCSESETSIISRRRRKKENLEKNSYYIKEEEKSINSEEIDKRLNALQNFLNKTRK
eukprot:snap_masked-scaffold_24-processed-gene-5.38-mRNA-1 protein AED:1.00 eAED:1.00 QI:0/-1/0/0/-1/1/1/0/414